MEKDIPCEYIKCICILETNFYEIQVQHILLTGLIHHKHIAIIYMSNNIVSKYIKQTLTEVKDK